MYAQLLKRKPPIPILSYRFASPNANIDHYAVLGIKPEASTKEIKSAYYKLSKQHHPDTNPDDKEDAARKFHEVAQAYEVLGSDEQRRIYDLTRIRTSTDPGRVSLRRPGTSSNKQYTDIDIDYKTFEQFQRNTRRRRQFHSHFEMPDEFYSEFGSKKGSRVFKSEYDEVTEKMHTMYKDSRAAQREEEELQREVQREQEKLQRKYPIPTFEQMIQERRNKESIEQKKYLTGLVSISTLGLLLFILLR